MNGKIALPEAPMPDINPIDPVTISRGKILPVRLITMGYMGPRRTPIRDTAAAFPMSDLTNQMVNSSLPPKRYDQLLNIGHRRTSHTRGLVEHIGKLLGIPPPERKVQLVDESKRNGRASNHM